jgi:hypothetical protein
MTTYDIIGKVAIDHTFDCLGEPHGDGGRLFEAYEDMQQLHQGGESMWYVLATVWPILDKIMVSQVEPTLLTSHYTLLIAQVQLLTNAHTNSLRTMRRE